MNATDVIVVGGGVIGQTIAWRTAQRGRAVTLVDPDPGRGASWAAAGMLAPVAEAAYGETALLRANAASHRRWPTFARALEEASGVEVGYRECGTLVVAREADDVGELDRLHGYHTELGLDAVRLRGREARSLEPALTPGLRGAVHSPGDHQVDNRAVVRALAVAGQRVGVRVDHRAGKRLLTAGGRVRGLELDDGSELLSAVVVVAAGAGSIHIEGFPEGGRPHVRPVKGQLLHLRVPEGEPPLTQRTIRGNGVYIVSRGDGRVVVGATVEERGFDRRVTAGGVYELLRRAYELVPAIVECELVEATTGLRPGTPDNAPLVGQGPLDGLMIATGHYRNGMLLTPLTGDGMAQLLTDGTLADELVPFSPLRFTSAAVP